MILRGHTEAIRKVDVKAETYGRVIELKVEKGDRVEKGAVLARLSPEDRPARLAEAKALRDQRKIEYQASDRLSKKGYRAETQLAGAKAAHSRQSRTCSTQISVNRRRSVSSSMLMSRASRSRSSSAPSLCNDRRPSSRVSMRDGLAVLIAS